MCLISPVEPNKHHVSLFDGFLVQFIFYTVVCATVALDRATVREKVRENISSILFVEFFFVWDCS